MMSAGRSARLAVACGLAVMLAGCSGGAKHSAPTTTQPVPQTTVSPSHLVANLGPCAKRLALGRAVPRGEGLRGLGKQLVPVTALNVRVCTYSDLNQLVRSHVLLPREAAQFERLTNGMATSLNQTSPDCIPPTFGYASPPPTVVLTFASDSQQVNVLDACEPSNGALYANPSAAWRRDLRRYTGGLAYAPYVPSSALTGGGGPTG